MVANAVLRNIVLLFNNDLNQKFINLSKLINKTVPSKIVLNAVDELPHLSVYSTKYPEENLPGIVKELNNLVKKIKPFTLVLTSKSSVAGTIFVDAKLNKELFSLHNLLINNLNILRNGQYDRDELALPGITNLMKKNLVEYGMLLSKEEYKPHVTIARPFDSQRCSQALKILSNNLNFKTLITNINLVETGHDGTCKKVIFTFNFSLK